MKLKMMEPILDLDGDPVIDGDDKEGEKSVMTLRKVLVVALTMPGDDYKGESQEQKFKRGMLAIQAHTKAELELSAEDCAMLKRLVAGSYAPLVVYRVHNALDGNPMNPELAG